MVRFFTLLNIISQDEFANKILIEIREKRGAVLLSSVPHSVRYRGRAVSPCVLIRYLHETLRQVARNCFISYMGTLPKLNM